MSAARAGAFARSLVGRWEFVLVLLILAAGAWSASLSPFFLDTENLLDLMKPYTMIGLMALGLTLVVVAGEIDISVASTLAVCVVVFADVWQHGVNIWLACFIGLLVGTGLGLFNGVLVGVLHLPSLAVTLGTLAAYRGLAFVILGSEGITGFPQRLHPPRQRLRRFERRPGRAGDLRGGRRGVRGRAPRNAVRPLCLRDRVEP